MSNVYPVATIQVPSQQLLEVGNSIFSPFNPVLTSEVEISMDRPDLDDDESAAVPERLAFKEPRIPFGLAPSGTYFAAMGDVFDFATRFQDHVTPTVIDTLTNGGVGIDPNPAQSDTVLVAAFSSVLIESLETLTVPLDWTVDVVLHPTLVACGLFASTLLIPGGFTGSIRLPVLNMNPKMLVRLRRGHGCFAVRFFQNHMNPPYIPMPEAQALPKYESGVMPVDTHINRKN